LRRSTAARCPTPRSRPTAPPALIPDLGLRWLVQ
jgi:hypothetical protein